MNDCSSTPGETTPEVLVYCDLCNGPLVGSFTSNDLLAPRIEAMAQGWLIDEHLFICPRCRFEARCRREGIKIFGIEETSGHVKVIARRKSKTGALEGDSWSTIFKELVYALPRDRFDINATLDASKWVNIHQCRARWYNLYFEPPLIEGAAYTVKSAPLGGKQDVLMKGDCDGKEHFMRVPGPMLSFSCDFDLKLLYYEIDEV